MSRTFRRTSSRYGSSGTRIRLSSSRASPKASPRMRPSRTTLIEVRCARSPNARRRESAERMTETSAPFELRQRRVGANANGRPKSRLRAVVATSVVFAGTGNLAETCGAELVRALRAELVRVAAAGCGASAAAGRTGAASTTGRALAVSTAGLAPPASSPRVESRPRGRTPPRGRPPLAPDVYPATSCGTRHGKECMPVRQRPARPSKPLGLGGE